MLYEHAEKTDAQLNPWLKFRLSLLAPIGGQEDQPSAAI